MRLHRVRQGHLVDQPTDLLYNRPRKLKVSGSDGKDHAFLLKGHEDLRQDERVMQLFGLVNTLLQKDSETFKRHLMIQGYPIIPLAPNSGLIGWVDHTDTLHVLVKNYRDSRKILLNIEHRIMLQMAPDYDHMTLMQKIEVFEYALDNTTGQDLYRVLWLKSRNSEAWLDRRTHYTRTLATMSMTGHILGLGVGALALNAFSSGLTLCCTGSTSFESSPRPYWRCCYPRRLR